MPGDKLKLKAIDLTIDHKPDSPAEMKRILQMGGHVTPAGANGSPSRVWHNLRGLAMSRSIGDHAAATVGVIAEPEITEYDLVEDDFAIILASDGVWELLSSQSVADITANVVNKSKGGEGVVQEICDTIVDQSSYMWKVEEGDYRDDITVIVLMLPWINDEMRKMVADAKATLAAS
jgi:protein phosphatase 2C family protein 2/3